MLLYLGMLALVFYFLFIRPQQQNQKRQRELLAALKPGDRVMTASGIIGSVASIEGDSIMLRVAPEVVIEVAKGAVTQIIGPLSVDVGSEGQADD
jgi:preprotein translocase subunit YajC